MEYTPLTKVIGDNGTPTVVCKFFGTEQCRKIHNSADGCGNCPVLAAIINQLHVFEQIYMEAQQDELGEQQCV